LRFILQLLLSRGGFADFVVAADAFNYRCHAPLPRSAGEGHRVQRAADRFRWLLMPWATAVDPYHPVGWWEDLGLGADEFVDDTTE
jgi:hypothetical protein